VFSGQTLRPAENMNSWGSKVYNLAIAVVGGADVDEALFSNLKQGEILARIFLFAQRHWSLAVPCPCVTHVRL